MCVCVCMYLLSTDAPPRLWHVAQALKTGITQGVNRMRSGEKIVPNDADFLYFSKEQLQLPPSAAQPHGQTCEWKDYAPFAFRHLRQELGVDQSDYVQQLCSGGLHVSQTAGRSGAFFMVVESGRFFLKSLTKGEGKVTCDV